MKDYQQKRAKEYVLPEAVYRQALWAAKDLPRLEGALALLLEKEGNVCGIVYEKDKIGGSRMHRAGEDLTSRSAVNAAMLSMKIEAIEEAFYMIPTPYREGIRRKLTAGVPFGDDFHPNTWKKWQQICVFHVAKNLGLY